MSRALSPPAWQRAIVVLTATVVGTVLVCALRLVQDVLIPLALATYLAFLLNPAVRALEFRGAWRMPAVFAVVAFAGLLLGVAGWIVTQQTIGLLQELPRHTANMRAKIHSLQKLGSGGAAFERMVEDLSRELENKSRAVEGREPLPGSARVERPGSGAPASLSVWPWLSDGLTPALAWSAALALAFVLLLFMLLARDDLRSRFVRLTGQGMATTTKAVDDAGARISRYLLMQVILNGAFGVLVGVGLLLIGVPYAVLWGFLATLLRYVPYVGPLVAATFPIAASLVLFETWWQAAAVTALFLTLDLSMNNIVEPWLYGRSMGVSQVGLIVAAAFWFWMWGPVGLVLSAPLTVVLVVLGRHVPQLEFLDTLLGDEPALTPDLNFYQRLLAGDADEATGIVLGRLKAPEPEKTCDELLVPALNFTKRDRSRDEVTDEDEAFVRRSTREILDDLGERRAAAPPSGDDSLSTPDRVPTRLSVLACPAQDESDLLALQMLQQLMDPDRWEFEVTAVETLTSELVARVAERPPSVVCIGSLPPGGLSQTRYLCKRLRAAAPGLTIVVGRWGLRGNLDSNREQLLEAGADQMTTTLLATRRHLDSLHSVLAQPQALARVS